MITITPSREASREAATAAVQQPSALTLRRPTTVTARASHYVVGGVQARQGPRLAAAHCGYAYHKMRMM